MKSFARLYTTLDATTSTRDKLDALTAYFRTTPAADAAWAAYFLSGGKPRQSVPTRALRAIAQARAGLPEWLFDESYQAVGDLAETIAHVLPPPSSSTDLGLAVWIETRLLPLRGAAPEVLEDRLNSHWDELDWSGRFLLTKLIGGGFRVGVSRQLVVRALAEVAGIDHKRIAHRMVGWTDARRTPSADRFAKLIAADGAGAEIASVDTGGADIAEGELAAAEQDDIGLPYPFFLAHPLQQSPEVLGDPHAWQAEWKWDGIRAQMIKRGGEIFIWSRGEDLATEKFPELHPFLNGLPDGTVIDGEILSFQDGLPMPFNVLQTRIGRKNLSKKILEESPVAVIAYDCLEYKGEDIRTKTQSERRAILEGLQADTPYPETFRISALINFDSWEELAEIRGQSRAMIAEGIMLKRKSATYQVGRRRGDWWKWKIDPLSVDAVMIYAQKGHGRRADLYTDYTFAVWDGDKLVPFAKAYSGLTDVEINKVDYFIKRNTLEKFGPVRTVKPELVFEIGFEGINKSTRHKSGIALRFPRILRWRHDKPKEEADTLDSLRALLGE